MPRDIDYTNAMQRAMQRALAGAEEEDDRAGGSRLARRIPASALSVADIAEAVSDQLRSQRGEISSMSAVCWSC